MPLEALATVIIAHLQGFCQAKKGGGGRGGGREKGEGGTEPARDARILDFLCFSLPHRLERHPVGELHNVLEANARVVINL